jgi:hypothetical protein
LIDFVLYEILVACCLTETWQQTYNKVPGCAVTDRPGADWVKMPEQCQYDTDADRHTRKYKPPNEMRQVLLAGVMAFI